MKKIKRVNKNYYKIFTVPICGVFVDEYLMKKLNKILYKCKNEIDGLLQNNIKHTIKEEWALAYPKGKQESFYGTNLEPPEKASGPIFRTVKIKNLYFIGNKNIYSDEVKREVEKLMEKEKK